MDGGRKRQPRYEAHEEQAPPAPEAEPLSLDDLDAMVDALLPAETPPVAAPPAPDLIAEEAAALPPAPEPGPLPEPIEPPPPPRFGWVLPLIAFLFAASWLGAALWFLRPSLRAGLTPAELVQLIAALCMPLALIGIGWQLALRRSTSEARRFGHTAQAMRAEARALEATLAIVSAKVRENQQMLAEQTQALLAMGDRAAERLAATSNGMAHEIARADAEAQRLSEAATVAQGHLGVLLAALPRANEQALAIVRAIEASTLSADASAALLAERLAELGREAQASEQRAREGAERLAAQNEAMSGLTERATGRLEAATDHAVRSVTDLLGQTAEAVDQARAGIAAQGDSALAMLQTHQGALDRASRESIDALAARIAQVDEVIARMASRLGEQRQAGNALVSDLDRQFQIVEARIADFHARAIDRNQTLAASISALSGSADAMGETLQIGEKLARNTIKTSEDLLVALDAAAREIDETLPEALARLDQRIGASRHAVAAAKPELLALVTAAESTHDAIEAIAQVIQGQRRTLDELSRLLNEALAVGRERAEAIGVALDETIGRTQDFAQQAAPRLMDALMRVRDSAATAADRARETLSAVIPEAAALIESASTQAMQRALGQSFERHLQELAGAADGAVAAAQRASDRLAEQLLTIEAAARDVDNRIDQARAERDQAETESFGRRSSLLIEAMNSAAIDIAKAFSVEVADSSWAAYLKGDRGVFTRRAVRLIDTGDAREIAKLYDLDSGFRDQVNRYIHDFEAMLRVVLAQRDGAPIGVTLLSSDMGKLYVALAQAIERLRA